VAIAALFLRKTHAWSAGAGVGGGLSVQARADDSSADDPSADHSPPDDSPPDDSPPDHSPPDHSTENHGSDRGTSLVELLACIMLIGVACVAVLATLGTTITASGINRDQVNAHAWLQTASDVLYAAPRVDCGDELVSAEPAVHAAYNLAVKASTNPEGWGPDQINVIGPVLFWDGRDEYQATCFDEDGINLQLIEIEVRGPDGRIVESVQVVKG
jgi:hypothetical protein